MIGMVGDRDGWVRILHSDDAQEGDVPTVRRTQEIYMGGSNEEVDITVGDESGGLVVTFFPVNREMSPLIGASLIPIGEGVPFKWPVNCWLSEDGVSTQVEIDCPDGTPVAVTVYGEKEGYANRTAG